MNENDRDVASMQQPRFPFGPPFGPPFRPPFRPPWGPPVGPSVPPFWTPTPPSGPPTAPPPRFTPQQPPGLFAVDPGSIRPCLFRYSYIWLTTGQEFWAYLVFIGPTSVSGYRWTGFRWVFWGTDLRNISSFVCF